MTQKMKRMHINQPLRSQAFHQYHGMNVVAPEGEDDGCVRAWFTRGCDLNVVISRADLMEGWKEKDK